MANPTSVSIKELEDMRKAGQPHPCESWLWKTHAPLFWESLQVKPVSEKLAIMKAALEAGVDPNETDREPCLHMNRRRPLRYAIAAARDRGMFHGEIP